jgi:NTP pyrophosphatase (non-canonical NTP hydrolase)
MYFHRDCERGVAGTYEWLTDEVRELGEALKGNEEAELEAEFADVAAWLASLANIAGVDLEKATLRKHDNKCLRCGRMPCECTF